MADKFLFTTTEVAEILNVSEHTVRNWISSNKLEAAFIGQRYYIQIWDLYKFLDEHKGVKCTGGNPNFKAKRRRSAHVVHDS